MKKNVSSNSRVNFLLGVWPYIILIFAAAAVYFQTLHFDFTSFDDRILIIDNHHEINSLSRIPEAFDREVFSNLDGMFYRPLLTVTFIVDAALSGKDPSAYHATNLLLHILSVILLYRLLRKIGASPNFSLFFSLLFGVHPVLAQAVAWIPGRNDSLLALFILLSFTSYLNFIASSNEWKKILNLFFLFLFFLCALLTKETAVVFPVLALSHFFLIHKKAYNKFIAILSPLALSIAVWYFLRNTVISRDGDLLDNLLLYNAERIHGIILYIGKIFLPINLSPFPTFADSTLRYGIIALILLALSALFFRIQSKSFFYWGIAWFFLFLLPTLTFADGNIVYLEHRLYVPFIGLIISFSHLKFAKGISVVVKYKIPIASAVVVLLAAANVIHSRSFKDSITMWKKAEETSPSSSFVHNNFGNVYMREGNEEEAVKHYESAVRLNPNHAEAYLNLGYAFRNRGNAERAELFYIRAIELRPKYPKALNNLGNLYLSKKMFEEAKRNFLKAVEYNPDYFEAYNNLGSLYYQTGNIDSAEANWKKSIQINPEFPQAYYNLGALFYNSKEYEKAYHYFSEAQRLGLKVESALLNSARNNMK